MRESISKGIGGPRGTAEKEVRLSIIKAGLSVDGTQRYATSIRFANESWKKASNTEYVSVEIDRDEKRLYFSTGDKVNGFKLVGNKTVRTISFTAHDSQEWKLYEDEYNLLKDVNSGDYYIDLKAVDDAGLVTKKETKNKKEDK